MRYEEQAEKLKKVLKRDEMQRRELRQQRQRNTKQKRELRQQRLEIFQLRNELNATNELVEKFQNVPSTPRVSGDLEVGSLPDFVIIGAQKCGTTAFYHLLTKHPNVERAGVREVHYFDNHFGKGIEWYRGCFPQPGWKDGRRSITGEKTPSYLFHPQAAERMAQVVPQARLIALLRNPVDRAYSHYHHEKRRGRETRSFEEAVREEEARLLKEENEPSEHERQSSTSHRPPSNLLARGIYVDQLLHWSKFFDDEQMLVLKSEDFFKRTTDTLKLVQDFLDLPYRKLDLQRRRTKERYDPMDPATRRRLEAFFEPHNQRLYDYLGVDLGW
jgi:hypothetical protein